MPFKAFASLRPLNFSDKEKTKKVKSFSVDEKPHLVPLPEEK
jgi:hypothetical protein